MIFDPGDKELSASPQVTEDGEYLLLYLSRGTSRKNRLYVRPANEPAAISDGQFNKLFDKEDAAYGIVEHDGPTFFVLTNLDAPRRKLVAVNINHPEPENWKTIIPESADTISQITCVNNQFIVHYLHDAHDVVKMFDMHGNLVPRHRTAGHRLGRTGDRQATGRRDVFLVQLIHDPLDDLSL